MIGLHLLCDTPDSSRDENKYLERVFHKNNYNTDFTKRNIYRPTEADATNRNPTPVTALTIPYIKGTSETISRGLQHPCSPRSSTVNYNFMLVLGNDYDTTFKLKVKSTAPVSQWSLMGFESDRSNLTFFQALLSQLLKLCITAMINQVFISFSAVQIYDRSYINLHSSSSTGTLRNPNMISS